MINFPCTCNHRFSLPDDQAGGLIQCPKCGRLNDIPTLSDLQALDTEGMYKLDADPKPSDPNRLAEIERVWMKSKIDRDGNEIDLRNTDADYDAIGDGEIPLEPADEDVPAVPKYDPVTGELVRPMGVRQDAAPSAAEVPMATPVIAYARGETASQVAMTYMRPLIDLFKPANLVVIFFIGVMHVVWEISALVTLSCLFTFLAPIVIGGVLIAHYGNVIDEIGPEGHDELPRPLRNLSWHDDLWGPFAQVMEAFMLSYVPLVVLRFVDMADPVRKFLGIVALIAGTLAFPAMMLTATTSGTSLNLRPDRVLGVIRVCGRWYVLAVVYWLATLVAYAFGFAGMLVGFAAMFAMNLNAVKFWILMGGFGTLCFAIYVAHLYCVHLGLLYREKHESFPWILQRHRPASMLMRRTTLSPEEKRAAQIEREMRAQRRAQRQA